MKTDKCLGADVEKLLNTILQDSCFIGTDKYWVVTLWIMLQKEEHDKRTTASQTYVVMLTFRITIHCRLMQYQSNYDQ